MTKERSCCDASTIEVSPEDINVYGFFLSVVKATTPLMVSTQLRTKIKSSGIRGRPSNQEERPSEYEKRTLRNKVLKESQDKCENFHIVERTSISYTNVRF